jgi:hypothetical protein
VCSTRLHNLCGKDALRYTAHLYARLTSTVALRLSIASHSCRAEKPLQNGVARASFLIILLPAGQA